MAGRGPDYAGMTPEDWRALRDKQVERLRDLRRKKGKIPSLALKQAACLLDRSEDQVRRYVNDGDPEAPAKVDVFVFTDWLIMLANGYGAKIKRLHDDLLACNAPVPAAYLTFWRAWRRLSKETRDYARLGIKAHRKLRLRVLWEAPHRNAAWQVDVCQLDIWIVPKGGSTPVRPWFIGVIDDYSRMLLGWRLMLTKPRGADVQCVLASAMLPRYRDGYWYGGKPAAIRWDNGNEFLNKEVTLFVMTVRFDSYAVAPYEPTAKGKIERFFRTLQEMWLARLPGYSKGPRTTNKQDVYFGSVKDFWSDEKLIANLRERIDDYNFARPHGGINDHVPYEKWCADPTPLSKVPRSVLSAYFIPLDGRTRTFRTTGIHYQNKCHTCYDLPKGLHESDLIGRKVTLYGVPHEGSWLDVHGEDGRFLCTVVPVSSLTTEEIAKHGMRRDADRRRCDADLRQGAALRLEAASQQDPDTGRIATVAEVAVAELAIVPREPVTEGSPTEEGPMAQLLAFPEPAITVAVNRSRQKAARRRGPRRPPLAAQETTLPLEA